MGSEFYSKIHNNPIIAAVNDINKLDKAINSPSEIIFLLTGNIFNLGDIVRKVKEENKSIYIHLDLLDGFSKDIFALKYIAKHIKPDGIITTKSNLIKCAKDLNLFTIQRLFILDSLSLNTGINSLKSTKPDAVEILPGIMDKITKKIHKETKVPVITGGLIMDKDDVINSLKAGAIGISSSEEDIWDM